VAVNPEKSLNFMVVERKGVWEFGFAAPGRVADTRAMKAFFPPPSSKVMIQQRDYWKNARLAGAADYG
jgi:hypothetical protein